jgi:putative membrane protein
MKKTHPFVLQVAPIFFVSISILIFAGCDSSATDSVKSAKDSNLAKIDSQKVSERPADSLAAVPPRVDADFLVEAASGGMLEVQLGQLAQTNGSDPGVKAFGARMVKDHGDGGIKIKTLAEAKSVSLPATVSNQQQKELDALQKKTGPDFDKAYVALMVSDHKEDIAEFEKEASKGTDPDIRALASSNLDMLHMHLEAANGLHRTLK